MSQTSTVLPAAGQPSAPARSRPEWVPQWSRPAALRALRAVIVMPVLFALTYKGMGNLQVALFAAFGSFANLVMASFGGTRKDKAVAHLGLAVIGSVALSIGTAVNGSTALAAIVTIPVAFGIFFAGVAGPNAAAGITAALITYVLPVATAGTDSMIPDRLLGWWMACVVSTAAVLLLSPPPAGDRLRVSAANLTQALAGVLEARMNGADAHDELHKAMAAKDQLMNAFTASPYRPIGLATADQGLASAIQQLEWCTALIKDAISEDPGFPEDRVLLNATVDVLNDTAALLKGATVIPRLGELEQLCERCGPRPGQLTAAGPAAGPAGGPADGPAGGLADGPAGGPAGGTLAGALAAARRAFHEQAIAVAVRGTVADVLIATRRADPELIAARRRGWYGAPPEGDAAERRVAALHGAIGVLVRHASLRSVWLQNALRGSFALAAAVLVADLSGVQHGFWVVLGTMSVLRTNAATTESTALRALGGTVIGFVVGALLMVGIGGHDQTALWVALPIAVAIASYAPGALPFTFGQAAFTVVVVVLFNLLVPIGWKVGELRVEDVALGCVVSLAVGLLFWPRGAGAVVGDDMADAYQAGAEYLTEAVDWALGMRKVPPTAASAAITAGIRLDEALRGLLAEQGSKRVSKEDLWRLAGATTRLRQTAYSIAALRSPAAIGAKGPEPVTLARNAASLAQFYDQVAALVGRPVANQVLTPLVVPDLDEDVTHIHHDLIWIREHLDHLGSNAHVIPEPAGRLAEQRRLPWWR
jgi:uncharacterized membrane protein YccC